VFFCAALWSATPDVVPMLTLSHSASGIATGGQGWALPEPQWVLAFEFWGWGWIVVEVVNYKNKAIKGVI